MHKIGSGHGTNPSINTFKLLNSFRAHSSVITRPRPSSLFKSSKRRSPYILTSSGSYMNILLFILEFHRAFFVNLQTKPLFARFIHILHSRDDNAFFPILDVASNAVNEPVIDELTQRQHTQHTFKINKRTLLSIVLFVVRIFSFGAASVRSFLWL